MVGWHHQFNGNEFVQTLGAREGQGTKIPHTMLDQQKKKKKDRGIEREALKIIIKSKHSVTVKTHGLCN